MKLADLKIKFRKLKKGEKSKFVCVSAGNFITREKFEKIKESVQEKASQDEKEK
jgi:hypothetical protein